MLINKDCYYAIKEDLIDYKGKIDLIYIDPPFATGKMFKDKNNELCYDDKNFSTKEYSGEIEGLLTFLKIKEFEKNYLRYMYTRILLMKELLSEKGSIYVHCDWHIGHYLKVILDEIFGKENFVNEIVWEYRSGGASKKSSLSKKHDSIYYYSKKDCYILNSKYERQYLEKQFMNSKCDDKGRFYVDTLLRDVLGGIINIVENNEVKSFNLRPVLNVSLERIGYPTQKPEGLIELLINIASNEGSIVLDCFCGSGTTLAVAEKLKRKWIGCDINKKAIDICQKRINKIKE